MELLREKSGETIGLVIRTGLKRLQLEELQSMKALKYSHGKGFVAPIYAAASSKVLLSEMPFEERNSILNILEQKGLIEDPSYNRKKLLREISEVKENEFAISFGEIVPGASSIAVPVKGYITHAAICIFGPEQRFNENKMMEMLPALKKASNSIRRKIEKTYSTANM